MVTIWGTQNFGKQEMKGLEFEFDYIPYEGGKLSGWVTQMDSEVTSGFHYSMVLWSRCSIWQT